MRLSTHLSLLALLGSAAACTNLLGIDDFSEQQSRADPGDRDPPGVGGDAGTGGNGAGGNAPGTQSWAMAFGSASGMDVGRGVHVTSNDDLIITGTIGENVDFGGTTLGEVPGQLYVTRLDASGEFVRGFASFGPASVVLGSSAVDESGNAYVAGSYAGGSFALDDPMTPIGSPEATAEPFIAKISTSTGDMPVGWSVVGAGPGVQQLDAVATNPSGTVVAAVGFLDGPVAIPAGTGDVKSVRGGTDALVAIFDGNGDVTWVENYGSGRDSFATAVAVDDSDQVWVSGVFDGTIELASDESSIGNSDVFLARLSATGTRELGLRFGSGGGHTVGGIATTDDGIILVGGFTGTTSFGGEPLVAESASSTSLMDVFVVSLGNDGSHRWSMSFGGTGDDIAHSVVVDRDGNVVIGGEFSASIAPLGLQKDSQGGADAFVLKLDPSGEPLWCTAFGRNESDFVDGLAIDSQNAVLATGQFVDGFMLEEQVVLGKGMEDIFVAKFVP